MIAGGKCGFRYAFDYAGWGHASANGVMEEIGGRGVEETGEIL